MLTLFHDELPGVLSEQVVEGDENHRVRVDGLLADAPLQAVPVVKEAKIFLKIMFTPLNIP